MHFQVALLPFLAAMATAQGFSAVMFFEDCSGDLTGANGVISGPGGNECAGTFAGTKAMRLDSVPDGCQVTVYTDAFCSVGAVVLPVGQCASQGDEGIGSFSIDGDC